MASDRITARASNDLVERVDERVEYGPPEYEPWGQWVGEAMRLHMVFEDAPDREGITPSDDEDSCDGYLRDLAQPEIDAGGPPNADGKSKSSL